MAWEITLRLSFFASLYKFGSIFLVLSNCLNLVNLIKSKLTDIFLRILSTACRVLDHSIRVLCLNRLFWQFCQNFIRAKKIQQKSTSDRDITYNWSAHFLCLQSDAFPTELSWQVLIEGYLTPLLFVHQLAFGLRGHSWN